MTTKNYSIHEARELATHLNNISIFLQSASYLEAKDEHDIRQALDKLMFEKIEDLNSCLSMMLYSPQKEPTP
nr:hypothetical protein A152_15650 [Vibrio tasmaniensis 1F-187]